MHCGGVSGVLLRGPAAAQPACRYCLVRTDQHWVLLEKTLAPGGGQYRCDQQDMKFRARHACPRLSLPPKLTSTSSSTTQVDIHGYRYHPRLTASSAIEQERTIVAITSAAFSCSCCASTIPTCSYHVPLLLPFGLVLSLGILTTILPAFVLRSLSPQEPLATAQPSLPSGVVLPSHRRRRSCQHCSVLLRVVVRCASCETTRIRKSVGAREGKGGRHQSKTS